MTRTTRSEVEGVFATLLVTLENRGADVTGLFLDYASCYGGYGIRRMVFPGRGESDSEFGSARHSAGEQVAMMRCAIRALELIPATQDV